MLKVEFSIEVLVEFICCDYREMWMVIDLENQTIDPRDLDEVEANEEERDRFLPLPAANDLYWENEALQKYLLENELDIPAGIGPYRYLREMGYKYDFLEEYRAELKPRLLAWFKEKNLEVTFAA